MFSCWLQRKPKSNFHSSSTWLQLFRLAIFTAPCRLAPFPLPCCPFCRADTRGCASMRETDGRTGLKQGHSSHSHTNPCTTRRKGAVQEWMASQCLGCFFQKLCWLLPWLKSSWNPNVCLLPEIRHPDLFFFFFLAVVHTQTEVEP